MSYSSCNFRTPFPVVLYFRFSNSTFFFFNSSIMSSATNCITIINNVGAILSPFQTPQHCLKIVFSLPMFKTTSKSPGNFSAHFMCLSGAHIFFKAKDITSCLMLSYNFTISIKIACESITCSLLECNNVFNEKKRFLTTYFGSCTKFHWVSILLQ